MVGFAAVFHPSLADAPAVTTPAAAPNASTPSAPSAPTAKADPPSLFARATADEPIERMTFFSPGVTYLAWQPVRVEEPARGARTGAGLEVSFARWISGGTYLGAVTHFERLDRFRAAVGIEGGYQLVGVELGLAREFPERDGPAGQWSLQLAPYASIGMLYLAPRWIVALDRRARKDTPGDGAMFVVGLKFPIKIGG